MGTIKESDFIPNVYCNKVRISTYMEPELYNRLKKEANMTGESTSSIVASIVEAYLGFGGLNYVEPNGQTKI
jgi:hypothetical protein